jgi:hypothetical protein
MQFDVKVMVIDFSSAIERTTRAGGTLADEQRTGNMMDSESFTGYGPTVEVGIGNLQRAMAMSVLQTEGVDHARTRPAGLKTSAF